MFFDPFEHQGASSPSPNMLAVARPANTYSSENTGLFRKHLVATSVDALRAELVGSSRDILVVSILKKVSVKHERQEYASCVVHISDVSSMDTSSDFRDVLHSMRLIPSQSYEWQPQFAAE